MSLPDGVEYTGEQDISTCGACGTRGKNHHIYKNRPICGNCIEDMVGVETIEPGTIVPIGSVEDVVVLPTNHICINGRVYDVATRDLGGCKHAQARKIEETWGLEMNYCFKCGARLKPKAKRNTMSKAKGVGGETKQ